jgi:hypothetical protein
MIVEYGRELRRVEWGGRTSHNFLDSQDEVNLEDASDTTAKTRIYHVRSPRLLHRQRKSEVHWADTKLRPACLVNLFHRVRTTRIKRKPRPTRTRGGFTWKTYFRFKNVMLVLKDYHELTRPSSKSQGSRCVSPYIHI